MVTFLADIQEYRKIYKAILDVLELGRLSRRELIFSVIDAFELSDSERLDDSMNGRLNILRSRIGIIINDMEAKKVIDRDKSGLYFLIENREVAIRIEECEREILDLLRGAPKTKQDIKDSLVSAFGTDATPSTRDDNKLMTYMGQILKRLCSDEIVTFDGSVYTLADEKSAYIKNRREVLLLKSAFLTKLHSRGGEFFEHYFLNLLSKYLAMKGKIITESHVTGGSDDGGIDGVIRTADSLGFRETIMFQTKNRIDISTETDLRGFYGAVCAAQGSRGIFATTSDFHPMATKFLDSIDNCVGVNGTKICSMATETGYGIKNDDNKLIIDSEII